MKNRLMALLAAIVILTGSIGICDNIYADGDPYIISPSQEQLLSDINANLIEDNAAHPYIHATYAKIMQIKQNVLSGDKYTSMLYESVKKSADSLIDTAVIAHNNAVSQQHSEIEPRIMTLMLTYHIDGNIKYLERALKEFAHLQKITKWTAAAQLDNTQTAAAIAVSYDWLYNYLTDEQREWAISSIKEKCTDIAYEYYKDPSKLNEIRAQNDYMNIVCSRGSYNHCTYNNSNLAICALALAPLYPEYSAFILSNNMYNIQPYFEMVGEVGGQEEPVTYYGYTAGKVFNMLSAVDSALGTLYGYEKYAGFEKAVYYPLYLYGAGPFAFGDCSPFKSNFDSNFLYFAAQHSQNNGLMKLLASRFKNGNCIRPLLWYNKGELDNEIEAEKLLTDRLISPVSQKQNVAVFRDSVDTKNGIFAAMYAGCATANGHCDAVSGAFCLDAYGERFVTPIGLGSYNYPGYWDNSQNGGRWNWYEKRPEGANCLVINPSEAVGQNVYETALIDSFSSGDGSAYAVADLGGVYKDYVSSYRRGIKIHSSRTRVTLQDEAVMKEPSEIFWSFNTPAQIEIMDNDTALLTNSGKKVLVKIHSNIEINLYEMQAQKLPTSPQRTEQKSYPGYRKLCFNAENVTNLEIMAEFIPIATEYDMPDSFSEFEPMTEWNIEETMQRKPFLDNIYINGTAIENFEPDIYEYELFYEYLSDENPDITFDNSGEYDVDITFSESGEYKAVVAVNGSGTKSHYVIKLTQLMPEREPIQKTIKYTDFTSAMYTTDNPSYTGANSNSNGGWLPHLYSLDGYRHYYCVVDISSLAGINVTNAVYNLYCAGDINISVYALRGEFTPGSTEYANLPMADEKICNFAKNLGSGKYIDLDFTTHIQKLLSEGENKLKFMIVQNIANTTCIAGEKTYTEWKPSISVTGTVSKNPLDISDITFEKNSGRVSAQVSIVNNAALCLNGYCLFVASYDGNKLKSVSVSKSGRIMPYRERLLTADINDSVSVKAFLWNMQNGIIPIKSK